MANSSPLRKSQLLSDDDRSHLSSFLLDGRNTETSHRDALAAAQAEHARVRDAAIRAFELHELKQEHSRIVEQERREQERLHTEAIVAAEEKKLQELRAKSIPKPAPVAQPEQQVVRPIEAPSGGGGPEPEQATTIPSASQPTVSSASTSTTKKHPDAIELKPDTLFLNVGTIQPPSNNSLASSAGKTTNSQVVTEPSRNALPATQTAATQQAVPQPPLAPTNSPSDRYLQIHQALKKMRKDVMAASKLPGSTLKGKIGSIRREIRVSIGQLTSGKGANTQPTNKILGLLSQSIDGSLPSPPIDVGQFVATSPDVPHNSSEMPSLLIYQLNIIAKGIIAQFINECGANPKAADPIGVFTAHIFSNPDFLWQGRSLIDILLAKFRIACPVLFGYRGNDKTVKGRQAVGWKRDGPSSWIPEQNHNDRMAGLGAGFAAISLRDFSNSSKTNPYPPTNYWKALASIVNCGPGDISNTQLVVLRSMIDGHEQRFLNFYGNAAIAALKVALIEVPKKAPANSSAAGSLRALADMLRTDAGLVLA